VFVLPYVYIYEKKMRLFHLKRGNNFRFVVDCGKLLVGAV